MKNHKISFIDLQAQNKKIADKINAAVLESIKGGNYIMGPEVFAFEKQLSKFTDINNTVSCSNGTDALILALLALGIKENDAIFVPDFTFAATAEAVVRVGATPVFVDVNTDTFNINVQSLQSAIKMIRNESNFTPRAVIPVDLFGLPANYHNLQTIAHENKLKIIVDAAQSLGATCGNKCTVKYGDIATTSFFPAKPLGCYGDGGAVFTDDDHIAEILRSLRVHGKGIDKYDNVRIGLNARLDTLQAAILIKKLEIFPEEIVARNRIAKNYSGALSGYVTTPFIPENCKSVWAQYTIKVKERNAVQHFLKEKGIPTVVYYPLPLTQQTAYKHYPRTSDGLTNSKLLSKTVLSLPMHPYLKEDVQQYIIENIKLALKNI